MNRRTLVLMPALALALLFGPGTAGAGPHCGGGDDRSGRGGHAHEETEPEEQFVRVLLQENRFRPETIRLKAGIPVRLLFRRADPASCADELRFPTLGVPPVKLPADQDVVVELGALEAGNYPFSCPMGMVGGTLQVKP